MAILSDKVAIVTGSARGIGRATAELFSAQGAKVLINDLDGDVAEQTASEIDGDTLVFGGDLTKPGVCDELVEKVIGEWGQVDILVNNAGYTIDAPIHKMSDDTFQRMIDILTPIFAAQHKPVKDGLKPADLYTNEFINPSVGLSSAAK